MALRISIAAAPSPSIRSPSAASRAPTTFPIEASSGWRVGGAGSTASAAARGRRGSVERSAKASLEIAGAAVGQVTEVNQDTFWPIVKAAGSKIVVLDMYTQWCGPCKVMAPKFKELSEKYLDTVFLKLDCNKDNKELAKELGIRVVPTFKILKGGEIVNEVTGAKLEDLVLAIETARSLS